MKNIYKELKTSIVALGLFALVWFKSSELGNILILPLIVISLGLLFAKDSLTLGLETLFKRKSEKL